MAEKPSFEVTTDFVGIEKETQVIRETIFCFLNKFNTKKKKK